jgi:transcription factor SPN1
MSDDEGLFADSDDTAELISSSKPAAKKKQLGGAAAAKRKRNEGKSKKIPDADNDDDEDLFDSDDDDDEGKKPKAKKPKQAPAAAMSKKERMEALQKKKRASSGHDEKPARSAVPSDRKKAPPKEKKDGDASDSEDSYNSADFQLNEDDRNFIDTEGDDADAINELYAEQHFDDKRGEADEDMEVGRKKGRKGGGGRSSSSKREKLDTGDLDNPIMAAVHRMKKKKAEKRSLTELEEEVKPFLERMERAAEEDELAVKERRPGTKKLQMLGAVVEMFAKREMTRVLLDLDALSICRRWIQPLPNGSLGNVTIRQRLLDSIEGMNGGEAGISATDLKRSEFGKVVMSLYMHKDETPSMKRKEKSLIELWSRPIFQKSGNMRDLERVHAVRGDQGLARTYRQNQQKDKNQEVSESAGRQDINSMIKSGKAKAGGPTLNRVRIPYSKGFQFTVRPTAKFVQSPEKGAKGSESRDALKKRMMEKTRAVSKNQRSANVSVEGRATK